jgi:hypothetical protein
VRVALAILMGCAAVGCSTSVAGPAAPVGLTCTAPNGAVVRLNLDLAGRTFQKEGFPRLPIASLDGRQIVLMRDKTANFMVSARIDRATMDYVALSEDRKSHTRTETRYSCITGPGFAVANTQ